MKLPDMKIRTRMSIGFTAVILLMLLVSAISRNAMHQLANATDKLYLHPFTVSTALLRIDGNIERINNAMLNVALASSAESVQVESNTIDTYETLIMEDFARVEERFLGDMTRVLEAKRLVQEWKPSRDRAIAEALGGNGGSAANDMDAEQAASLEAAMQYLVDFALNKASVFMEGAHNARDDAVALTLATLVASVIAAIVLAWFITRSVTRPLHQAVRVAERVANGDLSSSIESTSQDEAGQLLRALKSMNDRLLQVVAEVRQGGQTVCTAAMEMAQGNDNLSQRTHQQASSLEQTAASMEEMAATVNQNANNARKASNLAAQTRDEAEQGGKVVTDAVRAMNEISNSSRQIAEIISVIDEIAFQTNLLALNAAVEAARAGEQGRGFAVVASEVRALAQRSAAAAKEIKTLIDDSNDKVRNGSDLVDQSGKALLHIVESVRVVTNIVAEIATASHEQSTGIAQVNKAVMQMDELTQNNAALVEEAAVASRAMGEQADQLVMAISFFKSHGSHPASVTA